MRKLLIVIFSVFMLFGCTHKQPSYDTAAQNAASRFPVTFENDVLYFVRYTPDGNELCRKSSSNIEVIDCADGIYNLQTDENYLYYFRKNEECEIVCRRKDNFKTSNICKADLSGLPLSYFRIADSSIYLLDVSDFYCISKGKLRLLSTDIASVYIDNGAITYSDTNGNVFSANMQFEHSKLLFSRDKFFNADDNMRNIFGEGGSMYNLTVADDRIYFSYGYGSYECSYIAWYDTTDSHVYINTNINPRSYIVYDNNIYAIGAYNSYTEQNENCAFIYSLAENNIIAIDIDYIPRNITLYSDKVFIYAQEHIEQISINDVSGIHYKLYILDTSCNILEEIKIN